VVRGKDSYNYSKIDEIFKNLRHDSTILDIQDLGAGSASGNVLHRKVSKCVRNSSINSKYGRLLSRLVQSIKPSTIIELGTGAGFSTMYMAEAYDHCKIFSIESCTEIAGLASRNINNLGLKNTEIITGSFSDVLPVLLPRIEHPLFIFIDGDHNGEHLLGYFKTILPFTDENTVFVLDDIRWSISMEKAWKQIIKRQEVSVSIDLFRMGILFLMKNINKQDYVIKF
jgi:predicted O-methyltransferase YrrM